MVYEVETFAYKSFVFKDGVEVIRVKNSDFMPIYAGYKFYINDELVLRVRHFWIFVLWRYTRIAEQHMPEKISIRWNGTYVLKGFWGDKRVKVTLSPLLKNQMDLEVNDEMMSNLRVKPSGDGPTLSGAKGYCRKYDAIFDTDSDENLYYILFFFLKMTPVGF
jgi:hypothetical protein